MRQSITVLASAAMLGTALIGPAFSQGAPQTVTLMKVVSADAGYRLSSLQAGWQHRRQRGRRDGRHDRRSDRNSGRTGTLCRIVGWRFPRSRHEYVVVPFPSLQVIDKRMVLRGATKGRAEGTS